MPMWIDVGIVMQSLLRWSMMNWNISQVVWCSVEVYSGGQANNREVVRVKAMCSGCLRDECKLVWSGGVVAVRGEEKRGIKEIEPFGFQTLDLASKQYIVGQNNLHWCFTRRMYEMEDDGDTGMVIDDRI